MGTVERITVEDLVREVERRDSCLFFLDDDDAAASAKTRLLVLDLVERLKAGISWVCVWWWFKHFELLNQVKTGKIF